ncbi:nmrA family transcriptional regulator [Aspergillus pseudoustus]|uniref:NmrA family transcriptional regulator n=1 Tax=Aspergillus pseudoustus TaxID=1810923 RepID=A0ABR4JK51_9EURO
MPKKILVVFGATGNQGGSVAKAILNDPATAAEFHVRAVTRDPSKAAALALADLGAELIKADMEDKDALRAALKDAYGVYLVTNMFEHMNPAAETRQGKNVADIAKETSVKHLIWSSLPHISKISNGKYTAALHFDGKAYVDEHLRTLNVPHTIIRLGTYTNFVLESLVPLSDDPPSYGLFFPEPMSEDSELPLIDPAADAGKFVKAILKNPEETLGREYNLGERYYKISEILATLKKFGIEASFKALDHATFKAGLASKGAPEFFQEDLVQVIQFGVEYGFFETGIEEGHKLIVESLTSLEESLKQNPIFAGLKKL